jgi:hypothetical protein
MIAVIFVYVCYYALLSSFARLCSSYVVSSYMIFCFCPIKSHVSEMLPMHADNLQLK